MPPHSHHTTYEHEPSPYSLTPERVSTLYHIPARQRLLKQRAVNYILHKLLSTSTLCPHNKEIHILGVICSL